MGGQLAKRGQVKYGTDYINDTHVIGFTHEMPEIKPRAGGGTLYHAARRCARRAGLRRGIRHRGQAAAGIDPLGKEIRVDTSVCEIIGVGKKRGSVMGQSQDNWVIMPLTTYQPMYAQRRFGAASG